MEKYMLVDEFRPLIPRYESFGKSIKTLLETLLDANGIQVHTISCRVKDPEHLKEKLTRRGKHYKQLTDVTDLVGLRVITYFDDDIDKVAEVVRSEFSVDNDRSVDKRIMEEPDRFGYRSLHQICALSATRLGLAEYRAFRDIYCEIQIRSILQHAWAEIEHDLGYKAVNGVPLALRRRFSILSSLLELTDAEFIRLRHELQTYSQHISEAVLETPSQVEVDVVSLKSFLSNPIVSRLDRRIAAQSRATLTEPTAENLASLVPEFSFVGITTIKDLGDALARYEYQLCVLIDRMYVGEAFEQVHHGIVLFVLAQLLFCTVGSVSGVMDALDTFHIAEPDERMEHATLLWSVFTGPEQ